MMKLQNLRAGYDGRDVLHDLSLTAEAGKITVLKLNVDENPDLAMKYQITSIPAMKVFQGGEVKTTIIGAKPKFALEQDLAAFIG